MNKTMAFKSYSPVHIAHLHLDSDNEETLIDDIEGSGAAASGNNAVVANGAGSVSTAGGSATKAAAGVFSKEADLQIPPELIHPQIRRKQFLASL